MKRNNWDRSSAHFGGVKYGEVWIIGGAALPGGTDEGRTLCQDLSTGGGAEGLQLYGRKSVRLACCSPQSQSRTPASTRRPRLSQQREIAADRPLQTFTAI